jgi:oxygen-independent coproporphyrinogen-3 oxidase
LAESADEYLQLRNPRCDIPETLLRRLDVPGPRYTSYPTADRFVEAFGPRIPQALRQRATVPWWAVSCRCRLYVHIPFCESVCYYCACNKVITKHHERGASTWTLNKEMALHVAERARAGGVAAALRRRLAHLPVRRRELNG